jgi:HD-like signal output (HDOD) protein
VALQPLSQATAAAAATIRMQPSVSAAVPASTDAVRARVQQYLDCDELAIPLLPDVAVRVVGSGTRKSADAQLLAGIIESDAALSMYILRIAASAAKRPASPIVSLQHAIAWLGLDEVANIAFTLALQGKLLDVKGQQRRARRLWRHSLASALWSRQLAHMLARETNVSYLCGLLHNIGKVVALGAIHDVAHRMGLELGGDAYDALVDAFQREVGRRVLGAWRLPEPVPLVISHWESYATAGCMQWESNVVNMAHKLADFTLHETSMLKRDELIADAAYRDLGLTRADGETLFDSAASIGAELDRYLAP